ncbi:hypothetical protein PFISCL1PPCAC_19400, partial [Pristionchus fissidentatus]
SLLQMVSNGTAETTIVKAKFLNDIRKTVLRHNQDVTFNDLALMVQRIFSIKPSLPIQLKYKDSEGDFISLNDDNDLLIALQTEASLFVEVSVANESTAQLAEVQKQIACIQSCIEKLSRNLAGLATVAPHSEPAVHEVPSPVPAPISPPPEIAPATIQPSLHQQVTSESLSRNEHVTESRGPDTSATSIEEEIHLGGEAASVFSEYPPASIPSFPQAQAPLPPVCAVPDPVPSTPSQPSPAPTIPSVQQPIPQYPSYGPPPTQHGAAPPASFAPPPTSFGAPPSQFGAVPPPTQFGGAPPSAPPSNFGAPPASFAPPVSSYAPPPPSMTPQPQYGAPGGVPPPPSSMGAPPSAPPSFAPPAGVPQYPPSSYAAPSAQYGAAPPPTFTNAPPTGYPPVTGGYAPPPMGVPPMGVPPMGAPPMGGAPQGGNPFSRPDYRQSPYHHQ